ncbi:triose-phosphate isomerase [Cellvibrio mixtus]|uniref:triose-phosphate isomerase n=1 Tax=Cellvibrio mixtus TaxID=39650 RepID=UPI0009FE677B|nr:triose-phosphate isomerase [Cellvibrio mixtus]
MFKPSWLPLAPALGEVLLLSKASNAKRRQLVVGNWKMNGNLRENADLLVAITNGWQGEHGADVVICPPFPYLNQVREILHNSPIILGAQTVHDQDKGAFTGEVSASMLADLDCKFVIIGHNERRRMQHESDQQVAEKFAAAQKAGLTPILCVGESLQDREQGIYLETISRQLNAVFAHTGKDVFDKAVLAYEPVWAVGTGKTATPEQAEEVHKFMRAQLGALSEKVRILYGGSVKAHNAQQLFALADIDGALLGGASLDANEFLAICKAAE